MVAPRSYGRTLYDESSYDVHLDIFEGPLDLLLYLIRREEIDIYDIPIAYVTRQYLEYVELMRMLNLDQAGEFLLMAATLMEIKSRMLLPREETAEEEEEDPREELVQRLLEYQRYKELSGWLERREEDQRDVFYRAVPVEGAEERTPTLERVSLFSLLAALKAAMSHAPRIALHRVSVAEVSVDERMEFVLTTLDRRDRIAFMDLVAGAERIVMAVTFIAILELIRTRKIVARQSRAYGAIWIYRGAEGVRRDGTERSGQRTS